MAGSGYHHQSAAAEGGVGGEWGNSWMGGQQNNIFYRLLFCTHLKILMPAMHSFTKKRIFASLRNFLTLIMKTDFEYCDYSNQFAIICSHKTLK